MATKILGLVGRKQSGKDTFAQRLVERHGFTRLAFADPLKKIALAINPEIDTEAGEFTPLADLIDLYGWDEAKEQFSTVRRLLQDLGVSVRDNVSDGVWVQALAHKAYVIPGPVVVTDCRFPNEAQWIRATGGETIRIVRPGQDDTDTHVSETALDAWVTDHVVHNDGSVEKLHETADYLVEFANYVPRYVVTMH